jgi:hypothetical protein
MIWTKRRVEEWEVYMIPHRVSFEVGISRKTMCEARKCYELFFFYINKSFLYFDTVVSNVFLFADLILSSAFH